MSQLIQHYQTSFVVRGGAFAADIKVFQAQYLIRSWIEGIENRRFRSSGRDTEVSFLMKNAPRGSDFKKRSAFRSKCSWCKTDYFEGEKSIAWVVEYTHRASEERNIFWVTEIGLHGFYEDDSLVINIRNSYKLSTEFALTGRSYAPSTSIPNVVEGLLETFDDCQFYSGDINVTSSIKDVVLVNTVDHAGQVAEYINNEDRKLAVVLIGGESQNAKREAAFLSRNLFGKALVYLVSFNHDVVNALKPIRLQFDECLFIPSFRVFDKSTDVNLKYRLTDGDLPERHELLFRSWLGFHPIYERGSVGAVQDVRRLAMVEHMKNFSEELKKRVSTAAYAELQGKLGEASEYLKMYEEENQDLRKQKDDLKHEKDELKKAKDDVEFAKLEMEDKHKEELRSQREKFQGQMRKRLSMTDLPRKLPLSVENLQDWSSYFTNLIVVDKAWSGMVARDKVEFFETAWEMLWCLNKVVFDFYSSGTSGVPNDVIVNGTGYEFSSHESETTKNNSDWSRERVVTIGKKTFKCYKHLKKANGASNAMRVYFDFDPELNRIIVAHIGEHLTTKGTSRT